MDKFSFVIEIKLFKCKVFKFKVQEIIGELEGVQEVKNIIDQVGLIDVWVFIFGLNGIGKEFVVCWLYEKSVCLDQFIIEVNCVAILVELIESELFGYEKGVFIFVYKQCIGKFE